MIQEPTEIKRKYIGFTGMIDDSAASRLAANFNIALLGGAQEIHFCLSSVGGNVHSGIYLYNHIRALPVRVIAYNTGSVCSIAVTVFLAASERYSSAHGAFMVHSTSLPPSSGMTAGALQGSLKSLTLDDTRTDAILRERTAFPEEILTDRRIRDIHITPEEAISFGLIQAVQEFKLPPGGEIMQV